MQWRRFRSRGCSCPSNPVSVLVRPTQLDWTTRCQSQRPDSGATGRGAMEAVEPDSCEEVHGGWTCEWTRPKLMGLYLNHSLWRCPEHTNSTGVLCKHTNGERLCKHTNGERASLALIKCSPINTVSTLNECIAKVQYLILELCSQK